MTMFFLGESDPAGDQRLGQKAFNLHRLLRRGYRVPPGFVLPAPHDPSDSQLLQAIESIGGFPVAVRSSGHLEDLPDASFAGQYDTVLEVDTLESLRQATATCRTSAGKSSVQTYLRSRKLDPPVDHTSDSIAVLVQKMVPAQWSGVGFSIDPLSGKEENFVLELCTGLGERLVSGHVSPTRYIVDHRTLRICAYMPGKEALELSRQQLKTLGDLLLRIQAEFGSPQDVEWAMDAEGALWILQSRPITRIVWRTDLGEYSNADLKDGGISSAVCTPMMYSLYNRCFSESMARYLAALKLRKPGNSDRWMVHKYGIVYWNVGIIKAALHKIPGFNEQHLDSDLGIEKHYGPAGPRITPTNLRTVIRAIPVWIALGREYSGCRRAVAQFKRRFDRMDRLQLAEIRHFSTTEDAVFFGKFEAMLTNYYLWTESSYFRCLYNNSNYQNDFKKFIQKMDERIGGETPLLDLMLGLSEISHLEIQKAVLTLFKAAQRHSRPSRQWQEALQRFLQRFYFQGDRTLDLCAPRWGEAPEVVVERIDAMLKTGIEPSDPDAIQSGQRQRYERAFQQVLDRIEAAPWRFRRKYRRSFCDAVRKLRTFMIEKEKMRELSTRSYYVVRRYLLEAGCRLCAGGLLAQADDIFFLHIDELLGLIENRNDGLCDEIAARMDFRKKMFRGFRSFTPPNEIGPHLDTAERLRESTEPANGHNLVGIGCSPGMLTGSARVINDLSEVDTIQAGEVLVTRFTDPAWTPVLGLVAAVVTEVGGILSHAAVISREYGIPAVLNAKGATDRIKTGQQIRVNGSSGVVTVVPETAGDLDSRGNIAA
jgi:phosphohistidine swiveling domain-containing protein